MKSISRLLSCRSQLSIKKEKSGNIQSVTTNVFYKKNITLIAPLTNRYPTPKKYDRSIKPTHFYSDSTVKVALTINQSILYFSLPLIKNTNWRVERIQCKLSLGVELISFTKAFYSNLSHSGLPLGNVWRQIRLFMQLALRLENTSSRKQLINSGLLSYKELITKIQHCR